MPNLPARYESQVAAQANRRVIDQPTFAADTSMGDAIQNVGKVGLEIAGRMQKAKTDGEIIKAEIDARTRLDRLKLDLEADAETPDEAIPVRWRQESEAILKEAAGAISSESARTLWSERAKGWQGEGENWSVGLQRRRQVGKLRAGFLGMAAEAEALAGDASITADAYAVRLDAMRALNAQQVAGGIVDPETSAKREADLAALAGKDRALRWNAEVGALADQGQFDAANALVAEGDKAGIPRAYVEDAKSAITSAKNRIEKERNERMNVNDANFQVDVMAGKKGYRHVDEAIARGELDPSRRDTLYRVVREEEDRRKREAEESKLSAADRAKLEQNSKDNLLAFELLAQDSPANFMADPAQWSDAYKQAYGEMTPGDQRAVLKMHNEMRINGRSANTYASVLGDVMAEAKRFAPSLMDEKANKDGYVKLQGILFDMTKKLAVDSGGKPITAEQARKTVLQALGSYDSKKYGAGVNLALNFDADLYRRVVEQMTAKSGRAPTNEQALAAYNSVVAD